MTMTANDLALMGYTVRDGKAVKVKPRPRSEKDEVRDADDYAKRLGFVSVHFSQPRPSKQTPGIPDRLYLHRATGSSFWWEAKTEEGVTSVSQEQMHSDLRACAHAVVVGDAARAVYFMKRVIAEGGADPAVAQQLSETIR